MQLVTTCVVKLVIHRILRGRYQDSQKTKSEKETRADKNVTYVCNSLKNQSVPITIASNMSCLNSLKFRNVIGIKKITKTVLVLYSPFTTCFCSDFICRHNSLQRNWIYFIPFIFIILL